MAPDATTIRRLAGETDFQPQRLEKVIRLCELIAEVARHHELGGHLRLKGGTALNVYHLDLPRLSVDADFNFQDGVGKDALGKRKDNVETALDAVAQAGGYALERSQDSHALRAYQLRYDGVLGSRDHIKLDINYLERVPVLKPVQMTPPEWLPVPDTPVPVLDLDELAGSKVATLMLRGAPRDLFDVAQLAELDIDRDLVRRIAVFHGFLADLALADLDPERMDRITAKSFKSNLQDLLPKRSKYASMKPEEAVEAMREAARPLVESVLELEEIKACKEELAQGEWNPGTLFGTQDVDPALAEHPGMAWRFRQASARDQSNV